MRGVAQVAAQPLGGVRGWRVHQGRAGGSFELVRANPTEWVYFRFRAAFFVAMTAFFFAAAFFFVPPATDLAAVFLAPAGGAAAMPAFTASWPKVDPIVCAAVVRNPSFVAVVFFFVGIYINTKAVRGRGPDISRLQLASQETASSK